MKKLILIAVLLFAMVFAIVACDKEQPDKPAKDTTAATTTAGTPDENDTTAPAGDDTTTPAEDDTTSPAEETTAAPLKVMGSIDSINGKGSDGAPSFSGKGVSAIDAPVVFKAADDKLAAIGDDFTLTIAGWLGLEGGVTKYMCSVDGGVTWINAKFGGVDGEPLPGHYDPVGGGDATKLGKFQNADQLGFDLKAYQDTTVTVQIAALSKLRKEIVVFAVIEDIAVPADPNYVPALSPEEAGANNNHIQKDSQGSDNNGAWLAGWCGFSQPMVKGGYTVDGGKLTWVDGAIVEPEPAIKDPGNGGEFGMRYSIRASLSGLAAGDHEVKFYLQLEDETIVLIHEMVAEIKDLSNIGASTNDFNSDDSITLEDLFTFQIGAGPGSQYTEGPYKITGINQLTATMDGTYTMTIKNVASSSPQGVFFVRGTAAPDFGDPNYFGHNGNNNAENWDNLAVGCGGIYACVIEEGGKTILRISVTGNAAAGTTAATLNLFKVELTGRDITVTDDNKKVCFYEGDKLLASVELTGDKGGFAEQAVVTLADGTSTTLTDLAVASTVISDIGFVARTADITFDGVSVKGLAAE